MQDQGGFRGWIPVAVCIAAASCGGGGGGGGGGSSSDGGNTPPPTSSPPPPEVITGVFRDASVSGLAFESGEDSGTTGADGRFTCESGATVSFSVGSVLLGSADCATLVTPASLVAGGDLDDVETVNRVRFLLMLDRDGDPTNGIEISEAVQEVAESWAQPDFATADLDTELVDIISDAFSVDQTMHDLPDAATALAHLQATAECAYAGAFAGTMSGDLSGAITIRIGSPVLANSPFNPGVLDWRGVDSVEEFFVGGGGSNSVSYGARPVVDHTGPNLAGPMTGEFETPDRISGSWEFPPESLGGTFTADRMGDDTGEYRFVGAFSGGGSEGSVVLNLTGSTVTGEAFEIVPAETFQVSGSLTGDTFDLTATGSDETVSATATLMRDTDGNPVSINGTWDDGVVRAAACRLN